MSAWTGGRGRPRPGCPDCRVAQQASDGTWLPSETCPRHSYDAYRSVDPQPDADGMGSADEWQEWP